MIQKFITFDEYLKNSPISSTELNEYLLRRKIGIFLILPYKKARQWPWYHTSFNNENPSVFPILWAFIYAESNNKVTLVYEIHPMKCFPHEYQKNNHNFSTYPVLIGQNQGYTLAGCRRDLVYINGKQYDAAKQHDYCSAFGLPDDCYDEKIIKNCFTFLESQKELEIWCFEANNFLRQYTPPSINIHFMKDEFLPSKNFFYKDTSSKILSVLYKNTELSTINKHYWYRNGKDFIAERNYGISGNRNRFEETSLEDIEEKIVFELIREIILLKEKNQFKLFSSSVKILKFDEREKIESEKTIERIKRDVKIENQIALNTLIDTIKPQLDRKKIRNSQILVMDMEFITVIYPTKRNLKGKRGTIEKRIHKDPRSLKFPCIVVSIIWNTKTNNAEIFIHIFTLPCHYCKEDCREIKNHSIRYQCQHFADSFIESQIAFFEDLLAKHASLKIISYGKSDLNQLEYADNFFNDSFDFRRFKRKDRKLEKRIVDIAFDISEPNTKLSEIESKILETWVPGWSRKRKHVNVNRNFSTKLNKNEAPRKYKEAIETCVLDAISTLLYLIYKNYRKDDNSLIKTNNLKQTTLSIF